jgi:hypothetical protein
MRMLLLSKEGTRKSLMNSNNPDCCGPAVWSVDVMSVPRMQLFFCYHLTLTGSGLRYTTFKTILDGRADVAACIGSL